MPSKSQRGKLRERRLAVKPAQFQTLTLKHFLYEGCGAIESSFNVHAPAFVLEEFANVECNLDEFLFTLTYRDVMDTGDVSDCQQHLFHSPLADRRRVLREPCSAEILQDPSPMPVDVRV